MKMIVLLIALLIVGLSVYQQIKPSSPEAGSSIENVTGQPPKVPQSPQEVKKFGQDLNTFVIDSADDRLEQADQMSK